MVDSVAYKEAVVLILTVTHHRLVVVRPFNLLTSISMIDHDSGTAGAPPHLYN